MSITELSPNAVTVEVYHRAVRMYRNSIRSWVDCFNDALVSVEIEMDVWMMAPTRA
jgi:hypothetical protein